MPDFTRRVLNFIRQEGLVAPHESVLVGVSGGIDSTALLFVLHSLAETIPFSLAVAHVNHMLRGRESERDEAFVKNIAYELSLPFYVRRVNVRELAKNSKRSVQHAGRDARYDYFLELAETRGYSRVAIAHNQDDQVETFVLRIIKGTGVRGLSCIPVKRGAIIRPFLKTTRKDIEQYVAEKNIRFVEDTSNMKDAYERNYVRHQVLPSMEKLNRTVHARIMSLLEDLTDLNQRLDRDAAAFFEAHVSRAASVISLPVNRLKECDEETRFRVLSVTLGELAPGFIALREHIRLIEKVLGSSRPNSLAVLPSGITARREYGVLICTTAAALPRVSEEFPLNPGRNILEQLGIGIDLVYLRQVPSVFPAYSYTAYFDADTVSGLRVRTFRNGDRFIPLGMMNTIKLKDYFISKKIPRSARANIPLLISGDNIAWVIGERIDERFKVTDRTTKVVGVTVQKLSTESGEPVGT